MSRDGKIHNRSVVALAIDDQVRGAINDNGRRIEHGEGDVTFPDVTVVITAVSDRLRCGSLFLSAVTSGWSRAATMSSIPSLTFSGGALDGFARGTLA